MQYSVFRQRLGTMGHDATVAIARTQGIQLINNNAASRATIDQIQRMANARECPKITIKSSNTHQYHHEFSADTIGNEFPMAIDKCSKAIVFTARDQPRKFWATTRTNGTARSACNGFRTFTRDAGWTVHATMVSRPIHGRTVNGTEFAGEFAAMMNDAGINVHNSVVYDKPGIPEAESAAARAQEGMRVQNAIAAETLATMNIHTDDVWSYAIRHGSLVNNSAIDL